MEGPLYVQFNIKEQSHNSSIINNDNVKRTEMIMAEFSDLCKLCDDSDRSQNPDASCKIAQCTVTDFSLGTCWNGLYTFQGWMV